MNHSNFTENFLEQNAVTSVASGWDVLAHDVHEFSRSRIPVQSSLELSIGIGIEE